MMDAPVQFEARLRQEMEKQNISASALAKQIGVSHVTISNYLAGDLPKSKHLLALSKVFGVRMEFLLTGQNPPDLVAAAAAFEARTIFDQIYEAKNLPAAPSLERRDEVIAAMTARMLGFEPAEEEVACR